MPATTKTTGRKARRPQQGRAIRLIPLYPAKISPTELRAKLLKTFRTNVPLEPIINQPMVCEDDDGGLSRLPHGWNL